MVPVNQSPWSLRAVNVLPSAPSLIADRPPKPLNDDVRIRPERNSSAPKRVFDLSAGSNAPIGRARTVSEDISATRASRVCPLVGEAPGHMTNAIATKVTIARRVLGDTSGRKNQLSQRGAGERFFCGASLVSLNSSASF